MIKDATTIVAKEAANSPDSVYSAVIPRVSQANINEAIKGII